MANGLKMVLKKRAAAHMPFCVHIFLSVGTSFVTTLLFVPISYYFSHLKTLFETLKKFLGSRALIKGLFCFDVSGILDTGAINSVQDRIQGSKNITSHPILDMMFLETL
jgi:hypothetical protein